MKKLKTQGAQGDVLFRRVGNVPAGYEPQKRSGPVVVAHSETGHNHVVEGDGVLFVKANDPLISYFVPAGAFADIVHHRPYDTHETIRLLGGGGGKSKKRVVWEVRRQREYTPQGWRRVED